MTESVLTPLDDWSNIYSMSETKEKIIEEGTRVLLEKGYNGAGLKEILDAASVPKGSFYHFFKNKEDFGIQALEHYSDAFKPLLQTHLLDSEAAPLKRINLFFEAMIRYFDAEKHCKGGCLVGNLAQELADTNTPIRHCIMQIMASWNRYFVECLEQARSRGELPASIDIEQLVEFIMNSWEGALVKMKITHNIEPLKIFNQQIERLLTGLR